MCNLADCAGYENAAQILLNMLMREEGFDADFYTGIATIHTKEKYIMQRF